MQSLFEALRALERGDLDTLRELLAAEPALAGARDAAGVSLILHALYRHLPGAAALLLERTPAPDLPTAAAAGDVARLGELLAAGVSPSAPAADGFLPLHLAAYFGQREAARALLDAGADPNAPAAGHPSGVAPLASAVAGGDRGLIELLLERGAAPDPTQAGGFTPLQAAAARGDRDLCRRLLDAGADPRRADDAGRTAADHAADRGHADLARELRAPTES